MSLGALTTTFSPPASCLSSLSQIAYSSGAYYQGPVFTSDCFPEGYNFARTNYYSPGVCPSGYYSVGITVNSAGNVRETVVTCCPPGMVPNTDITPIWAATMGCSSAWFRSVTFAPVTILSNGLSESTQTTVEPGGALNAYSIQIRFQASDFATTTSTTSSTSTGTSATATSTDSNGTSEGGGSSLSTGAIVGIAIGSVAGALLLAAACVAAFVLGRKQGKNKSASGQGTPMAGAMIPAPPQPLTPHYGPGGSPGATQQYPYSYSPVSGKPMFGTPHFTPTTHLPDGQVPPPGAPPSTMPFAASPHQHQELQQHPVEMPVPDAELAEGPHQQASHQQPSPQHPLPQHPSPHQYGSSGL